VCKNIKKRQKRQKKKDKYGLHETSPLLFGNANALPQALNLELLARTAAVDILNVIRRRLKVAGCIIALGNEDVVFLAVLEGFVDGDRWALYIWS